MKAKQHLLKTWPEFFTAIIEGRKWFEIRKNDRKFKVGDVLHLVEFDPETKQLTGRQVRRVVTYITDWEQREGNVVMSLNEDNQ